MAKTEQIRASIANMDSEIVKDALSIILAKDSVQNDINTPKTEVHSNYNNFAQAILSLKRQYKFPELDFFSVEADLVYVTAGDRRVLLTDKESVLKNSAPLQSPLDSAPYSNESESLNQEGKEDSVENAFEPIKNNESRFSHLEL